MNTKKVLIIGAKGMLGQELVRVFLADENYEVIAWDRKEIDITDETQVKDKIGALAPEIIINAAAYNAVDEAEEPGKFELAKKLNGLAPRFLAQAAKDLGAIFVHYSTDYVFDGEKKEGYLENDKPSPICNYGFSKLMGERQVEWNGGQYYIIRLQKLFGQPSPRLRLASRPAQDFVPKKSFFDVMLELAKTKKELEVVDGELANFTYAPDLAQRTKWLIENIKGNPSTSSHSVGLRSGNNLYPELVEGYPFGIYHITNEGAPATWYGAAKILFEMAQQRQAEFISASGSRNEFGMTKYEDIKLIPVSGENFPRPAKRPQYSILLNTKLPPLRPWNEALKEFLNEQ